MVKFLASSISVLGLGLALGACGGDKSSSAGESQTQGFADESLDPNGAYTAVAADLFTGQEFIQTGATIADAIRNALELCNARTSPSGNGGCALKGAVVKNGMGTRVNGDAAASWACVISENIPGFEGTNRSWIGLGATPQAARKAAEDKCASKAGIHCQVQSCFNADTDKN